jgi:hypothetical protein
MAGGDLEAAENESRCCPDGRAPGTTMEVSTTGTSDCDPLVMFEVDATKPFLVASQFRITCPQRRVTSCWTGGDVDIPHNPLDQARTRAVRECVEWLSGIKSRTDQPRGSVYRCSLHVTPFLEWLGLRRFRDHISDPA